MRELETTGGRDLRVVMEEHTRLESRRLLRDINEWGNVDVDALTMSLRSRLSTELGDLIETVNKAREQPVTFDYQFDATGHPEQYYCRSDHYMYARYGIPIAFFTTGNHRDYHQVTDEPEYIDYDKLAHVSQFVYDIATAVANLDHRVVVDKPKPDPHGNCVQ